MSNNNKSSITRTAVTACLVVGSLILSASALLAQEEVNVTASVPDNTPPTTPILISPNNGSYVTDSTPNFVWVASTDSNGIGEYELYLDGSIHYDNIPTTATDNASYTLTFNAINSQYTLTPKSVIADGNHTWRIRAVDTLGNGTSSATWSFIMDTQAPAFVINQLGTASVSISAQDPGTIPATPLVLTANSPLITATGEANSSVAVTLFIPGDPNQNFANSINGSGAWSLQLGILPRDVVMTLNITITDQAGNVSVLNGVQFTIPTPVIVFPPTPTPTATPVPTPTPTTTPIPTATPTLPPGETPTPTPPGATPTPTPVPTPVLPEVTPPPPFITIPVIPPQELIFNVVQEILERVPEPIRRAIQNIPQEIQQVAKEAAPYSGALVASALPAASAVAIGSQFGGGISFNIILKILQALGLIPAGKPQGLVFNSKTYEPVPFALLTITNPGSNRPPVVETVVTDVFGVYKGVKLPPDTYQITVSHQDFKFPTSLVRTQYVLLQDFYKGELFQVNSNEQEQLFLIPVDPLSLEGKMNFKTRLRVALAQTSKLSSKLLFPLFLISGILAALFPSVWNTAIVGIYSVLLVKQAFGWFRSPRVTGVVVDDQGNPVQNAVIRLSISETNQLTAVITTNKKGEFKVNGPKEKYEIVVTKPGFIWMSQNSVLSFYEIDATQENQHVVVNLQPVAKVYEGLF